MDSAGSERGFIRVLLAGGVVGPPLFVVVFVLEGLTRPDYNPWRHMVSALALGDLGWIQTANFLVCGILVLGFSFGLWRSLGPGIGSIVGSFLLAAYAIGLIVAGIFPTDPGLGYPPGVPEGVHTTHGIVHALAGLFVFLFLSLACFVLGLRFLGDPDWRGWSAYSIGTGVAVLLFFIGSNVASVFDATAEVPNAPIGLLQRIAIVIGWAWVTVLAFRLFSETE